MGSMFAKPIVSPKWNNQQELEAGRRTGFSCPSAGDAGARPWWSGQDVCSQGSFTFGKVGHARNDRSPHYFFTSCLYLVPSSLLLVGLFLCAGICDYLNDVCMVLFLFSLQFVYPTSHTGRPMMHCCATGLLLHSSGNNPPLPTPQSPMPWTQVILVQNKILSCHRWHMCIMT
jgi:hypothetical protein